MGIYLSASSKNVIKDNQVSGCKNVGIYAYDGGKLGTPSTENQVLDNVISGIGGDGILMENGSDGCEVSRNRISSGKKERNCSLGQRGLSDHSESGERLYAGRNICGKYWKCCYKI